MVQEESLNRRKPLIGKALELDHPEFIAMVNELEADILEQRQWYEENKDKPLW